MIPVKTSSCEPTVVKMTVTPTQASAWLEKNNINNRPVSDSHVRRLARDMKRGKWFLTHEGIAFDPSGVLLDGQHRLWAVMEADVSVEMHVWFNITPSALMAINDGKPRSLRDILRLAGEHGHIGHRELAVLKAMLGGSGGSVALTPSEAAEALTQHREAVAFAIDAMPQSKRISNATTRGVIARAYYSQDHQKLKDFGHMLATGIVPDLSATSVILLRHYLQSDTDNSMKGHRQRYGKMQRALFAYLHSEPINRLYASTQEHFPLPEEVSA